MFLFLSFTVYLNYYSQILWAILISLSFLLLWPSIGILILYRGNIQQIRLSKIFDMFLSTFLLLSLSLFILLTISGILEITIKSLLGYDIFSYITFKNNNIPLSINL